VIALHGLRKIQYAGILGFRQSDIGKTYVYLIGSYGNDAISGSVSRGLVCAPAGREKPAIYIIVPIPIFLITLFSLMVVDIKIPLRLIRLKKQKRIHRMSFILKI
jgi:hypothetical protein